MTTQSHNLVLRRRLSAMTAGLMALAIGTTAMAVAAHPAEATHTPGSCNESAEFSLSANLKPAQFVGHLTRGPSSAPQPAYFVNSFGGFFMDNDIVVFSQNGVGCDVALDTLDLPPGVTSQMPPTLTVRNTGVGSVDLMLQASSVAELGDATVTIRATLGDQVRTLDLPITVEQEPDLVTPTSTVVSGGGTSAGVLTNTADDPTVVQLSSSDPSVAQVPESITISSGSASAAFQIDAQSVRGRSATVVITASLGDTSDSFLLTVVRR